MKTKVVQIKDGLIDLTAVTPGCAGNRVISGSTGSISTNAGLPSFGPAENTFDGFSARHRHIGINFQFRLPRRPGRQDAFGPVAAGIPAVRNGLRVARFPAP